MLVTVAALIIAVVTVVAASLVTYNAARRQIEASLKLGYHQIIAPMRQAWINKLRERIAAYIGISSEMGIRIQNMSTLDEPSYRAYRELLAIREEIYLLLHMGEEDHEQIAREVHNINQLVSEYKANDLGSAHGRLREITQKVLKAEWEVTKKMDDKTLAL